MDYIRILFYFSGYIVLNSNFVTDFWYFYGNLLILNHTGLLYFVPNNQNVHVLFYNQLKLINILNIT